MCFCVFLFFFFFSSRRRHTRWTGDWSSDVCSSDLRVAWWRARPPRYSPGRGAGRRARHHATLSADYGATPALVAEIGRASCRERVEISVVGGSVKKEEIEKEGVRVCVRQKRMISAS